MLQTVMDSIVAPSGGAFLSGSVGAIPLRTAAVLEAIKHAILAGELRPGQSLVEAELAQQLGVSKTPVREALKTLAGAGLVTMSPYRGAAGLVLDRADASSDEAERSLANREFHRALYQDCGNPLLVAALDDLRDQTALISAAAWQHQPSWQQEAGEHRTILAAAAAGEADRAGELLAAHIASFAERQLPGKSDARES